MTSPQRSITAPAAYRLLRGDTPAFVIAWLQWVGFHTLPLAIGVAYKAVLDRITDGPAASPWGMLAVLGAIEIGRWCLFVSAAFQWHGAFVGWMTVPRVNALTSLATAPGTRAHRLPSSPGEAVSRFRDDAQDVALVLDVWLDISGAVLGAGIAVVGLWLIEPKVTIGAVVPVLLALVIARALGARLRIWRRDAREATARVTGFVGDSFGAVLAVKAAGAEAAVRRRFMAINAARAGAARRDLMGTELVRSLSGATGELGIGMALLLAAPMMRSGELSVGDLGLFTSFLLVIGYLPLWSGRLGAYHRQAEISLERLAELHVDGTPAAVTAPVPIHLRHGPPPLALTPPTDQPLRELQVVGLAPRLDGAGDAPTPTPVDLDIRAGELVAITGPVGSGKSTFLRALLGLVPRAEGEIRWNGQLVDDPSTWLVPPRTAYIPQVPRLFSETLGDTILLGMPDDDLVEAVRLACLEGDVAAMPDGLATLVGARGVRLSGGQSQRAGAARALVRRPDLLVVDDLSSALDVETEALLWDRLLGGDLTAIVVTHRPAVLERAARIVVLGAVTAPDLGA